MSPFQPQKVGHFSAGNSQFESFPNFLQGLHAFEKTARFQEVGVMSTLLYYKVGPGCSYKWGELTPISRVITLVTHL